MDWILFSITITLGIVITLVNYALWRVRKTVDRSSIDEYMARRIQTITAQIQVMHMEQNGELTPQQIWSSRRNFIDHDISELKEWSETGYLLPKTPPKPRNVVGHQPTEMPDKSLLIPPNQGTSGKKIT